MPAVSSTAIRRIHYDDTRRRMSVWFESGERYDYADVGRETYEDFITADSKGRFFADQVRDRFAFTHHP